MHLPWARNLEDHLALVFSHLLLNGAASALLAVVGVAAVAYWVYSETLHSVTEKKRGEPLPCEPSAKASKADVKAEDPTAGGTVINEDMLDQMELLLTAIQRRSQ